MREERKCSELPKNKNNNERTHTAISIHLSVEICNPNRVETTSLRYTSAYFDRGFKAIDASIITR